MLYTCYIRNNFDGGVGPCRDRTPQTLVSPKKLFKTLITTKIMLSKLYFAPLPTLKPSYGPEVFLAL